VQNDQKSKPLVILTNFWDAESLLKKHFVTDSTNAAKTPNLIKLDNVLVYSIALSHPSFEKLPTVEKCFQDRITFLCPTYDMLKDYKEDKDWDKYVKRYKALLVQRKETIKTWIRELTNGQIYMLCCWEDTSGKAHCHRDILYRSFINSAFVTEHLKVFYRTGKKTYDSVDNLSVYINLPPAIGDIAMMLGTQINNAAIGLSERNQNDELP